MNDDATVLVVAVNRWMLGDNASALVAVATVLKTTTPLVQSFKR